MTESATFKVIGLETCTAEPDVTSKRTLLMLEDARKVKAALDGTFAETERTETETGLLKVSAAEMSRTTSAAFPLLPAI